MSAALLALVLILSVLFFGIVLVTLYEMAAIRRKTDAVYSISSYWTLFHKGRLYLLILMGVLLTALYVFLFGDLVLELW